MAGTRAGHAVRWNDKCDFADLIAHTGVGELFQGNQRVPDRPVGRQTLEQINRRIAGRNNPPRLRPVDTGQFQGALAESR